MEKKAILVCFSVQSGRFASNYERNKFFRALYGWKQVVRKETTKGRAKPKVYTYRRDGLLDEIPHEKIDQSSFIIPEEEFDKIDKFFREWSDKVIWRTFKVLLEKHEKFFEDELDV